MELELELEHDPIMGKHRELLMIRAGVICHGTIYYGTAHRFHPTKRKETDRVEGNHLVLTISGTRLSKNIGAIADNPLDLFARLMQEQKCQLSSFWYQVVN